MWISANDKNKKKSKENSNLIQLIQFNSGEFKFKKDLLNMHILYALNGKNMSVSSPVTINTLDYNVYVQVSVPHNY